MQSDVCVCVCAFVMSTDQPISDYRMGFNSQTDCKGQSRNLLAARLLPNHIALSIKSSPRTPQAILPFPSLRHTKQIYTRTPASGSSGGTSARPRPLRKRPSAVRPACPRACQLVHGYKRKFQRRTGNFSGEPARLELAVRKASSAPCLSVCPQVAV